MYRKYKYEKVEKIDNKTIVELILKYKDGSIEDEQLSSIIDQYKSLIKKIAIEQLKKYRRERTEEILEEAYNEGVIGLLKGFKNFKEDSQGKNLANFFYRYISNEISEYIVRSLYGFKISEKFGLLLSDVNYKQGLDQDFDINSYIDSLKESNTTKSLLKQYYLGIGNLEDNVSDEVTEETEVFDEKIQRILKEIELTEDEITIFYGLRNKDKKKEIREKLKEKISYPEMDEIYQDLLSILKNYL